MFRVPHVVSSRLNTFEISLHSLSNFQMVESESRGTSKVNEHFYLDTYAGPGEGA